MQKILNIWMIKHSIYKRNVWDSSVLSKRIISWILNADIILNNGYFDFKKKFLSKIIIFVEGDIPRNDPTESDLALPCYPLHKGVFCELICLVAHPTTEARGMTSTNERQASPRKRVVPVARAQEVTREQVSRAPSKAEDRSWALLSASVRRHATRARVLVKM